MALPGISSNSMGEHPFSIRPARPADVRILSVMKWQLALSDAAAHTVNASEADWHRDLFGPAPKFSAFVAERDGATAGMLIISERFLPGGAYPIVHVEEIFVLPKHRGCGIGKALLGRAAREAIGRRAAFVQLEVREDNRARKLYRKVGFERVRGCITYALAGQALTDLAGIVDGIMSALG